MAAAIDELAKECVQSQDAASTATLLDVLEKAGIAKRFRIHPESVVVADTNRDEYGVAVKDVCENVEDVVITKWHDSLFRGERRILKQLVAQATIITLTQHFRKHDSLHLQNAFFISSAI